jgi:hypothetical protein
MDNCFPFLGGWEMRVYLTMLAVVAAAAVTFSPSKAQERTFGGYECTEDCSGHKAGYEWAEEHNITDESDCGGNSQSFIEGCQTYTQDPSRGGLEDDEGNEIEE